MMPSAPPISGSGAAPQNHPFPLTSAQRGMWYGQQLIPDVPNVIANVIEFTGELNVDLLEDVCRDGLHAVGSGMLRLVATDGEPLQVVDHDQDDTFTRIDLRGRNDPAQAAYDWMQADYTRPFDLLHDRLIRGAVLRLDDDRYLWYSCIHHIVVDGYGAIRFINWAAERYSARLAGTQPTPDRIPDLTALLDAEDAYRASRRFHLDRKYWTAKVAGLPPRVSLADGTAPPDITPIRVGEPFGPDLSARLARAAKEFETIEPAFIVAAMATYLALMTDTVDITLSMPVSARTNAVLRRSAGMMANVVPVRLHIDRTTTVAELVRAVQLELTGALRHQRYRSEDLARDLAWGPEQLELGGLYGPSINIMNFPTDVTLGPVEGHFSVLSTGPVSDLTISIYPGAGGELRTDFHANHHLYDQNSLETHHDRWLTVLNALTDAEPTARAIEVNLLTTTERRELVPARGPQPTAGRTLAELIIGAASAAPERPAMTYHDTVNPPVSITYREALDWSTSLAHRLRTAGVGPETFVAVALRRSPDSVRSFWAVTLAGGAAVPVDPDYPEDRIAYMLGDSGVTIGLTDSATRGQLPHGIEWIEVDDSTPDAEVAHTGATDALPLPHIDQSAYVIYTSGSTGRPKGVVVTHRGFANLAAKRRDDYRIGPDSRFLHHSTPSFDMAVGEQIAALSGHAELVIAAPGLTPDELTDVIGRVTHAIITPTVLATIGSDALPTLQVLGVGGEAITPELVRAWAPNRLMFNGYGPSEATDICTVAALADNRPVTIGRPLHGFDAVVLDSHLRPVPMGVRGELYIGGDGLARGYHHRTGLTATRFVAHPWSPNKRMYRTGDVVSWTRPTSSAPPELRYHGRSDDQVKIRGQRVELGELESVVARAPGVSGAVVAVRDTTYGRRLVAYVVGAAGIEMNDVRRHCETQLPSGLIPDAYVALDELPRTSNGKLDHRRLPEPDFTTEAPFRAPSGPAETALAQLFCDILGQASVGADDSFFAFGGDSISALTLVSRARSEGLHFTPRDVFERKTVSAIARVSSTRDKRERLTELQGGGVGWLPLTPIMSKLVGGAGGFNRFSQHVILELPDRITDSGLTATLDALLGHHDVFAARLVDDGLEISATPPAPAAELLTTVDVDAPSRTDTLRAAAQTELDDAVDLLDPHAGAMVRFVRLRRDTDRDLLIIVVHHLIVDGVSWRIIVADLITAWAAIDTGRTPALPPNGTSFRRWAHALNDYARELPHGDIEYWADTSARGRGHPTLRIEPANDTVAATARHTMDFDAELTRAAVDTVPTALHASAEDVLVATLLLAVSDTLAESGLDVTGGSGCLTVQFEGHGRDEELIAGADLSRTVGWFTTTYPVLLDLPAADAPDRAVAAVRSVKQALRSVPGRGIGYGIARHLAHAELIDPTPAFAFNYLGRIATSMLPSSVAEGGWVPTETAGLLSAQRDPDMPAVAALDVNAVVFGDDTHDLTLHVTLDHLLRVVSPELAAVIMQRWQAAMGDLIDAVSRGVHGWTPSDVAPAPVQQSDLDDFILRLPGLVDVWPTSPLQQGFIYHSAITASQSSAQVGSLGNDTTRSAAVPPRRHDIYLTQSSARLEGTVDPGRMHRAADAVVARHPALRSAFVSTADGEIVAVIVGTATPAWSYHDRAATSVESPADPSDIREVELTQPFSFEKPPLIRFALVRLAPECFELIVTVHHVIVDGWSMPILLRDLLLSYAADAPATFEPAPTYRTFLEWLATRNQRASLDAWRTAFDAAADPTLVAPAHIRTSGHIRPGRTIVNIDDALWPRLVQRARENGVTPNVIIQSMWGLLIDRLTSTGAGRRDADATIGATVSGRPPALTGADETVGLFINTIPVRVAGRGGEKISDVWRRVHNAQAELLDHQHVGLADIVRAAGPGSRFDTLVVFESYPVDLAAAEAAEALAGFRVSDIRTDEATHYPLTVTVTMHPHPRIVVSHRPDAVPARDATRIAQRFRRFLQAGVNDPSSTLDTLGLLTDDERDALLPRRGPASVRQRTLAQIIADAVAKAPDRPALIWDGGASTYREADRWSDRLARHLASAGAAPETLVAVALSRSPNSVRAGWAVTKTGAAFVPLDPHYPPERIRFMIADSGATLGITDRMTRASLPESVRWIVLDDLDLTRDNPTGAHHRLPGHQVEVTRPAYLMYTSGSTGTPKGVVVTHSGLANLAAERDYSYRLSSTSRVLHNGSPSFDISIGEQMSALCVAAALVISDPADGPTALPGLFARHHITHAILTPTVLATLAPADLPSLEVLGVGGEAVSTDLVAQWATRVAMRNGYGPTEATDICTVAQLSPGSPIRIGRPVHGFAALVLDHALRPVPRGVTGELYISGPALARGYHRQPGLTASRFVANPYGTPGERMYRTGDLVSWEGDDELAYHGRTDRQIKVRGLRIEPGEIDHAFTRHADVRHAVTVAKQTPVTQMTVKQSPAQQTPDAHRLGGETVLVTYVVIEGASPGADSPPDGAALRRRAAEYLPAHLVPGEVIVVDAIPMLPSGKADESRLPEPEFQSATIYVEPETREERLIAAAFAEQLGLSRVGADDDYFSLGGTSLTAFSMLARLRSNHNVSIPIGWMLGEATPRALAHRLADGHPPVDEDLLRVVIPIQSRAAHQRHDAAPLFCIHPAIGLSWGYGGLARHVTDRAIYGIQLPGLRGDEDVTAIGSLRDLASRYVQEIRTVAPSGPYHLLGWSLGGVVAHAMAAEMQTAGDVVASVTLLDSVVGRNASAGGVPHLQLRDLISALGLEDHVVAERAAAGDTGDQTVTEATVAAVLAQIEDAPRGVDENVVRTLLRGATHTSTLLSAHQPAPIDGDVLLVTAAAETSGDDLVKTWVPWVGGSVAELSVPCTHWQMCSYRALESIGPAVDEHLRRAEASARSDRTHQAHHSDERT